MTVASATPSRASAGVDIAAGRARAGQHARATARSGNRAERGRSTRDTRAAPAHETAPRPHDAPHTCLHARLLQLLSCAAGSAGGVRPPRTARTTHCCSPAAARLHARPVARATSAGRGVLRGIHLAGGRGQALPGAAAVAGKEDVLLPDRPTKPAATGAGCVSAAARCRLPAACRLRCAQLPGAACGGGGGVAPDVRRGPRIKCGCAGGQWRRPRGAAGAAACLHRASTDCRCMWYALRLGPRR